MIPEIKEDILVPAPPLHSKDFVLGEYLSFILILSVSIHPNPINPTLIPSPLKPYYGANHDRDINAAKKLRKIDSIDY